MGFDPKSLMESVRDLLPLADKMVITSTPRDPGKSYFDTLASDHARRPPSSWREGTWKPSDDALGERERDWLTATPMAGARDMFTKEYLTDPGPDRGMTAARRAEFDREVKERRERERQHKVAADKKALATKAAEQAVRLAVSSFPKKLKSGLADSMRSYSPRWLDMLEDSLHRTNFRRTEEDYRSHHGYVAKIEKLVEEWGPALTAEWIASNLEEKPAPAEPEVRHDDKKLDMAMFNELMELGQRLDAGVTATSAFTAGLRAIGEDMRAARAKPRDDDPDALPDDLLESLSEAADARRGSW